MVAVSRKEKGTRNDIHIELFSFRYTENTGRKVVLADDFGPEIADHNSGSGEEVVEEGQLSKYVKI